MKKNSNDELIGTGLYLKIEPLAGGSLSKVFRQRICIEEKRVDLEVGRYPAINLSEARKMAATNLQDVEEGRTPSP